MALYDGSVSKGIPAESREVTEVEGAGAGVDVEIDVLAGVELEGAPPCECKWMRVGTALLGRRVYRVCGKPSVVRLRVRCGRCGADYRLFLCRGHAWRFRLGKLIACRGCGKVRGR